MHCEICDYSNHGISTYAEQVKHSYRKKVRYYPIIHRYLCTDCFHSQQHIMRIYADDEIQTLIADYDSTR